MRKCPCCKSLRVLDEAIRHPSVTSIDAVTRANAAFKEENIPAIVPAMAECPVHGTPELLDQFWLEYDRRCALVKTAAVNRAQRVFARDMRLSFR